MDHSLSQRSSDFHYRYRSLLSIYNHSIFHIITSSDVSDKLKAHFSPLSCYQIYIVICNPFILSETTKGYKTAVNSGKLVFVNVKSVYINGERKYS